MSTATTIETRSGLELLRVSADNSGRERSHGEQHDDNAKACEARGITLRGAYKETGSASQFRAKQRDQFPTLLADLRGGKFDADVLVLWESSRGSRDVGEWVDLIEACRDASVSIFVTTHSHEYDPRNARDRRTLLEDAVDSEYETAKMSARIKRSKAANRTAGAPDGRTPYGYEREYDTATRKLIVQRPYEPEAAIVRELYARIVKGESLRSIARAFDARGIKTRGTTRHGKRPFSSTYLRDLALRPANAALIVDRGERDDMAGGHGAARKLTPADTIKGNWEPLIDAETYWNVRRILTRPERKVSRAGRGKHLLSMIAKCDVCGSTLQVTYRKSRTGEAPDTGKYQCAKRGCVRVDQAELDELAERMIVELYSDEQRYAAMVAHNVDTSADLDAVRVALQEARLDLAALNADIDEGRVSYRAVSSRIGPMQERIDKLEVEERELIEPQAVVEYVRPGKRAQADWRAAPMSAKRELARMLLSDDYLGELRVTRRPAGRRNVHVPVELRIAA